KDQKDEPDHERQDEEQRVAGAELVLELAGPFQVNACWQSGLLGHDPPRLVHELDQAAAAHIQMYVVAQQTVFAADRRGALDDADVGDFRERHLTERAATSRTSGCSLGWNKG